MILDSRAGYDQVNEHLHPPQKKKKGNRNCPKLKSKVPGRGIEPRTRGFSVQFFHKAIPHHFQTL
jgi:hypothetical protein